MWSARLAEVFAIATGEGFLDPRALAGAERGVNRTANPSRLYALDLRCYGACSPLETIQ